MIIDSLCSFIASCPALSELEPEFFVDNTEEKPVTVGIMPTGKEIISQYMDGSALVQYNFAIRIQNCTDTDYQRIENSGLIEKLFKWFYTKTRDGELPAIENGEAESISCSGGMLIDISADGNIGTYAIACQLIYERWINNND